MVLFIRAIGMTLYQGKKKKKSSVFVCREGACSGVKEEKRRFGILGPCPWVRIPSDGESRQWKEEMIHIFMLPHTHIFCGYT